MIRVFIVAPTAMMRAGLRTMLASTGIQVVGESSASDGFVAELSNIDVIIVADETLLEDVGRTVANNRVAAIVVLSDNEERTLSMLRTLTVGGWSIVPMDTSAEQFQAAARLTRHWRRAQAVPQIRRRVHISDHDSTLASAVSYATDRLIHARLRWRNLSKCRALLSPRAALPWSLKGEFRLLFGLNLRGRNVGRTCGRRQHGSIELRVELRWLSHPGSWLNWGWGWRTRG